MLILSQCNNYKARLIQDQSEKQVYHLQEEDNKEICFDFRNLKQIENLQLQNSQVLNLLRFNLGLLILQSTCKV